MGWKLADDQFQQLNMAGAVTSRADHNRCLSRSRLKGAMHPQLAAPPIIRLKSGSIGSLFPLLARIGLGRQRSHFIQAQHARVGRRTYIDPDDSPFFPQTGDRVSAARGTSSIGVSSASFRLLPRSKWSSLTDGYRAALQRPAASVPRSTVRKGTPSWMAFVTPN
jgi:hypothetical protein